LPILSDILDVKEAYKAPVELYLEQYLNYFIVENIAEAIQGISLLKKSQKGKANFFLLDKLGKTKTEKINYDNLICATEVVKVTEKYQVLIDHLLAGCYIFNGEIEQFTEVTDKITIMSASGTFLKSGYSISGGSVGLFEGKKIGRKQNLEKLSEFLEENQKMHQEHSIQLEKVNSELSKVKGIDHNSNIELIKKELQDIDQERIKFKHQIDSFHQLMAESDLKIKTAKEQIKDLQSRISMSEQQWKALKLKLAVSDGSSSDQDNDIDKLSGKMSADAEFYNNDNIALIRQQNLIQNLAKDKDLRESRVQEISQKMSNDTQRLTSEERERIDIEDQLIVLDGELQVLYLERKNFQSNLGEAEQDYFRARNFINDIEDKIRNMMRDQSHLQQSIQDFKDKHTEFKFQIQAVSERLRIEFNIEINDIINQEPESGLNYELLNENLDRIKLKMMSYGDVNPLAVDAYNEIKERFDYINTQRKDILDAKDSLMETIKEIEGTATVQFMVAFEQVRTNFIEVFRSLFTEDDTCDLILLDESSPLESDIEIIAKPKGKKPKSLSQLSGGEKTLTSIALLFALYLLKPAPFCIFDEVDAPLDDANILKFNRIIYKFSKASQFIIVTHNKSTMAELDVLYGVYMTEPGVSAVSSVDFRAIKYEAVEEL
ncbi:MAG: chromosome segregation protein SMC, partial [Saprospiraceae bacterium]|nr:chromosome segregation protein SMC [Saprospiraceae bacterium]